MLIKNGLKINKNNHSQYVSIYRAVSENHIETISILLNNLDIDINKKIDSDETFLHRACE